MDVDEAMEFLDSLLSNIQEEVNRESAPEFDAKEATAPVVAFVNELKGQGFTREEAVDIFCSMMDASGRAG